MENAVVALTNGDYIGKYSMRGNPETVARILNVVFCKLSVQSSWIRLLDTPTS